MPLGIPVAGPNGNPGTTGFTRYGYPVFSAGAAQHIETMLIEALPSVLKFIQEVAMEGESFKNPMFEIFGDQNDAEPQGSWWGTPDGNEVDEDKGPKQVTEAGGEGEGDNIKASTDQVNNTANENSAVPVNKTVVEADQSSVQPNREASRPGEAKPQLDTGADRPKATVRVEDGPLTADGGPNTGHHDGKTDQDAQEMKDLVEEIKALKTDT